MKAPFPWFGGKSRAASMIWERFGNVPNYIEPFFGSGAVLLLRPHEPKVETVNDANQFLSNFWRAIKHDPEAVADHADWPVNETDLHARHYWLTTQGRARLNAIMGDPDAYDAKIAGWWVWGLCCWIGHGWCHEPGGPWQWDGKQWVKRDDFGRGVNRQLPHLGNAGQGVNRKESTREMFMGLHNRLRGVRVACGDWSRVVGDSVTHKHGLTGVFLDPPYADTADRAEVYSTESMTVAHDVRAWAIENGSNNLLRICLAGYEGEHDMPPDWEAVRWKAQGGYGSQGEGRGRNNASRECLWFSPHCLQADQASLF